MYKSCYGKIIDEVSRTLKKLSDEKTRDLTDIILNSKRIFITGKGRTGFIMKLFAVRLMQMGFNVHVLGEPTAPSIEANDLLLIGSGSGETDSLVVIAGKAKKLGARIAIITMHEESSIAKISDVLLVIPASGSKSDKNAVSLSFQPMCNLFEQSLIIFLDALSIVIMDQEKINIEVLYKRHANLE